MAELALRDSGGLPVVFVKPISDVMEIAKQDFEGLWRDVGSLREEPGRCYFENSVFRDKIELLAFYSAILHTDCGNLNPYPLLTELCVLDRKILENVKNRLSPYYSPELPVLSEVMRDIFKLMNESKYLSTWPGERTKLSDIQKRLRKTLQSSNCLSRFSSNASAEALEFIEAFDLCKSGDYSVSYEKYQSIKGPIREHQLFNKLGAFLYYKHAQEEIALLGTETNAIEFLESALKQYEWSSCRNLLYNSYLAIGEDEKAFEVAKEGRDKGATQENRTFWNLTYELKNPDFNATFVLKTFNSEDESAHNRALAAKVLATREGPKAMAKLKECSDEIRKKVDYQSALYLIESKRGNDQGALKHINRAIAKVLTEDQDRTSIAGLYWAQSGCYQNMGDKKKALKSINRALSFSPAEEKLRRTKMEIEMFM